jgi:hypothetical protein
MNRLTAFTKDFKYAKLLWAGLKPDTRANYKSAIRSYEAFCAMHGHRQWPATRQSLGGWIVERAWGNSTPLMGQVQGTTLRSYVSALRSVHVDLNLPTEVFTSDHITRLINGAINLFPARKKAERRKISREILLQLVSPEATRGETKVDRLNANAAFTTAFAGFMRMGEFTHKEVDLRDPERFKAEKLTRRCVTQSSANDYYTLFLPRSKTDYDNTGVRIVLAAANDDACPAFHINALLSQDPQGPDAPLLRLTSGAFTRERALAILNKRLWRLGIDPKGVKGHSFRKGAAQEAYDNHMSEDQIQALGRWSSEVVRRYFKRNPMRLFTLQKQFQTGLTLPLSTA